MLSYERKTDIVIYLSDPEHWRSRFSEEALMDETRRWKADNSCPRTVAYLAPDKDLVEVRHHNGSILRIDRFGDRTIIEDESGHRAVIQGNHLQDRGSLDLRVDVLMDSAQLGFGRPDLDMIGLDRVSAYAGFDLTTGQKTVVLDRGTTQTRITFPKASKPRAQEQVRTRLLHAVPFNTHRPALQGGALEILAGVVLVTAFDLGLEPNLATFFSEGVPGQNCRDRLGLEEVIVQYFEGTGRYESVSGADLPLVPQIFHEKRWKDTVEFGGHLWNTPRRFMIEATDDGFEVSTTLDDREAIMSLGAVLDVMMKSPPSSVTYNPRRGTPGNLLSHLEDGCLAEDFRGRKWRYTVIGSANSGSTAGYVRSVFKDNFDLSARHAGALSFREGLTLVAMQADVHAYAMDAERATIEVQNAVITGNTGGEKPEEFLSARFARGASLRRIDATAADGRRTFADLMREKERYDMLAALRDMGGVAHESAAPAPPAA